MLQNYHRCEIGQRESGFVWPKKTFRNHLCHFRIYMCKLKPDVELINPYIIVVNIVTNWVEYVICSKASLCWKCELCKGQTCKVEKPLVVLVYVQGWVKLRHLQQMVFNVKFVLMIYAYLITFWLILRNVYKSWIYVS